jgi:hypothetical protein
VSFLLASILIVLGVKAALAEAARRCAALTPARGQAVARRKDTSYAALLKCIALLRAAARLMPIPLQAPLRRGLKKRVLDMALGDLLPHTRFG